MITFKPHVIASMLVGVGVLAAAAANANTMTLVLVRSTLSNGPDAAGTWQYDGGTLETTSGAVIGRYNIERRVINSGSADYNVADEKMTLFFAPASASALPDTLTLEGVHSFSSGNFSGSVAAASGRYHYLVGAEGAGTYPAPGSIDLVLTYLGTNPF